MIVTECPSCIFPAASDLLTFRLPNNKLPGKDQISKQLLKTQSVIDLITEDLLGVPKGTYGSAGTEWVDCTRSDVLYTPGQGIQHSLPPILIEIQSTCNEDFMTRLLQYSVKAKQLYGAYPMVLIFCIDKLSPATFISKFKPIAEKPWMYALQSTEFWAKCCYIVSKTTISDTEPDTSASHLFALSTFLIEKSATLYGHSNPDHPTIQLLYRLAKKNIEVDIENEQNLVHVVDVICSNNEKLLRKVDDALLAVPETSKAKRLINRALEFNGSAKRKYVVTEDSDSSLEPLPRKIQGTKMEDSSKQADVEFISSYRKKLVGKMNWKDCLRQAHEQNRCKRFSTDNAIRSFYYHETHKYP